MNPQVHARVQEVFRRVFRDAALEIGAATSAADIEEWSSLAHIHLMVGVEQAFGIRFSLAEVNGLRNVGELVALVERKASTPGE